MHCNRKGENQMAIVDLLERNSKLYGNEVALVEINPEVREDRPVFWKEYELIQPTSKTFYRREILEKDRRRSLLPMN